VYVAIYLTTCIHKMISGKIFVMVMFPSFHAVNCMCDIGYTHNCVYNVDFFILHFKIVQQRPTALAKLLCAVYLVFTTECLIDI